MEVVTGEYLKYSELSRELHDLSYFFSTSTHPELDRALKTCEHPSGPTFLLI
jgi:hypothetical protein